MPKVTYRACLRVELIGFVETLEFSGDAFAFTAHVRTDARALRVAGYDFIAFHIFDGRKEGLRRLNGDFDSHFRQISSRRSRVLSLSGNVCARRSLS